MTLNDKQNIYDKMKLNSYLQNEHKKYGKYIHFIES